MYIGMLEIGIRPLRIFWARNQRAMSVLVKMLQSKRGYKGFGNSGYLLLYLGAIVLALSLWHGRVNHGISTRAIAALALIVALSFAYGRGFLQRFPQLLPDGPSLTLEFLAGYLILNTLLYLLAVVSPFAITTNILATCVGVVVLYWRGGPRVQEQRGPPEQTAELIDLLLIAAGATLWCTDGLTPFILDGSNTVFRLWGDSFVHARQISVLMHAQGWATLSDIRMSGAAPYLYHYASYAIPAAVAAMTKAGAYETFASFQLPVGILLSGLAAFALAACIWGRWAGVAASIAVVLIPDAYQQGFENKYLSYHFMQQVNIAGLYGVTCIAVAWIFVLRGCRTGKLPWILIGWSIAVVTLAYKAHIFVANAFLIMIYPSLFFTGLKPRWRLATVVGLVGCYLFVAMLSQSIDRMPTLRLDGSGASTYVAILLGNYDPGVLKTFFVDALKEPPWSPCAIVFYGACMILLSTFGFWGFATIAAAALASKRITKEAWLFPLLVMANYLVMALGLAMDRKEVGAPDELLNRPLVWAYFAVAAWTAGAAYFLLFGATAPKTVGGRALAAFFALLCLAGPITFAPNLQTYPRWAGLRSFKESGSFPTCLVAASRYIRDHSAPTDVVQDSETEASIISRFVVTALAERPEYAISTPRAPEGVDERLRDLAAFKRMTDVAEIKQFAEKRKIAWYVLRPKAQISWPSAFRDNPVFDCEGYRVYRFGS